MAHTPGEQAIELQKLLDAKYRELHELKLEIDKVSSSTDKEASSKKSRARDLQFQAGESNQSGDKRAAVLALAYKQYSDAENKHKEAQRTVEKIKGVMKQKEREVQDLQNKLKQVEAQKPGVLPI